jgi:hypothetical protein
MPKRWRPQREVHRQGAHRSAHSTPIDVLVSNESDRRHRIERPHGDPVAFMRSAAKAGGVRADPQQTRLIRTQEPVILEPVILDVPTRQRHHVAVAVLGQFRVGG